MKKQISIIIFMILILSSCANKKQITKSSLENNIITQIDSISNNTKQVEDSIEITIEEQIEETTNDTSNNQTTKRIINRRTNIKKVGNTTTKQIEETHKDIKEKKKKYNKSTNIKESTFKLNYIMIICLLILFLIYLYKFKKGKKDVS